MKWIGALAFLGLFSLSPILSLSQPFDAQAAALESSLTRRLPADGPGVVVLVARDGKLLFSHGYGLADRDMHIPATPETRFRIASVTKQFTAAAILHLAGEGRLSIDDLLAKYFPRYPGGDKITLRHLLTHTSGLHNYTSHPDFFARVTQPIAPADLVAWFQDDPPDFAPGEQFSYCNTGYVLLGQIVEKVSGLALGDYLQKQFFGPLGLHDTGLWHNATPPDHAAKGYSFLGKQLEPAIDWDMSWTGSAGGLYSTVGDLWRWTEALQGGRVLSPEGLREMITEITVPKKETLLFPYGMGLYHSEIGGLPIVGHDGGFNGFLSKVMWFPEQKMTIAVLGNAMPSPPGQTPADLLPLAARAFLGPEMEARAPKIDPTIHPGSYVDYAGSYDYGDAIQEISVEDGHLFAQLTGQDRYEIFPSGRDAFFFKIVEASLRFQRNASGKVMAVTHTQNGETFTTPLMLEKIALLPNETLDAIAGQYQYGPAVVMTVTRRGNQLYAQLTGQAEAPIFPKSDREFFWKIVPARVDFVSGKDGKIIRAIHHQNGTTFSAPKLKP